MPAPPTVRTAVALVLACTALAACTEAVQPAEPVTLQVMMADDWADTAPVLDVVRRFEADNPEVRVSLIPRPFGQIPEEAQDAADAGTPLDVVHGHAFAGGATGLAEPLDRWWADGTFDAGEHFDAAVADVTWGDTRYGVPLDLNAMLQFVGSESEGAPRTFDDVRALAARAAEDGQRGLTVTGNGWEAYGWVRANGGELVTIADDGTPTFTLSSPPVVEALEFLGELVAAERAYGPVSRSESLDAFELFGAGDTRLLASGTWSDPALAESYPDRGYELALMPEGEGTDAAHPVGGTALGGSSLFVGRGSDAVELSVQLIAALTADDVALELAREEGRFPTKPALFDQLEQTPATAVLAQQLERAHPFLLNVFPPAEAAFDRALAAVVTGRATAEEALAQAQADAERALEASEG